VARIAAFTLAMIFAFVLLMTFAAQRLLYPKLSIMDVAKFPLVSVLAQLGAYLVVLAFMYTVGTRSGLGFWQAINWNWPRHALVFLAAGVAFSLGLQGLAHLLPMPKTLPIDKFFQTPLEAWVLSLFGMTLAPLLEELFFRGFLYPVLARRLGVVLAVVLTAAGFSLIHVPQLAQAWGPVLIVFLIGLALTIVRAVTKSVAAGVLMHMAYNGMISLLLFIASGGFRHLEKLAQ
jgi:membrane protease YdiL (CAAX protease family)